MKIKRPSLHYFGGKWKHAEKIIRTFPEHKTFVDVFCGAASITLRKPRSKNEIVNDINKEITDFFFVLREKNTELRCLLEKTPYSREEYYRCREPSEDIVEQARRTIVKSWFGIGDSLDNETGFRVSLTQRGSLTRPWIEYVDSLYLYANRMRGVIIENLSYETIFDRYDRPGTLFYLDPPYAVETRSKKCAYKFDWGPYDHEVFLDRIKNIKCQFVLSGYLGEQYSNLPWPRTQFAAKSQFSSRQEYVWVKQ